MNRNKIFYTCQECGAYFQKWLGKCEECGSWGTVKEEVITSQALKKNSKSLRNNQIIQLFDLKNDELDIDRIDTKNAEINRVLGSGLVQGSVVLIAGEPGIGKSTLLLQLCNVLAKDELLSLYVSGEESVEQIKLRSDRLKLENNEFIKIANSTSVTDILKVLETVKDISLLIIDSIQTMQFERIDSPPGTVSQVRFCAHELKQACKSKNITLVLVGHITKEGQIAGPKILEHMVDTVLYFEGEHTQQYRIIRSIKNRYGSSNEIAIFEMTMKGLQEVKNPSAIFLSSHEDPSNTSGSCILPNIEGTRTIMLEVQALVAKSFLATPRRATIGWDQNRLAMLIAVLNSRLGMKLMDKEVYLNIVGGLKITETAADLAVIASLISALHNIPIPPNIVIFGEVGLSGEVRQVPKIENRLSEASKLGFKKAIIPYTKKNNPCQTIRIPVKHIYELNKIITSFNKICKI